MICCLVEGYNNISLHTDDKEEEYFRSIILCDWVYIFSILLTLRKQKHKLVP